MVLVDATPMQSEHRHRGVGTYTTQLATRLAALIPAAVTFAATAHDRILLPEEVQSRAIFGRRGHRPAQVYWTYNEWFLRRCLRRSGARLFHATDFNGVVLARGVTTITTLHDLTALQEESHGTGPSDAASRLRWTIYSRHKLPRVSHIIAISDQVKADAVALLDLPEERITVIPLGVDVDRFVPATVDGPGETSPYLLYVGNHSPNKNFDRVLTAFTRLATREPTVRLIVAGYWADADLNWLTAEARACGLGNRITHRGFVSAEDLPALYAHACAFVFPSIREGFGLPVLEAMASGTPVITSNRGVLAATAGDAAVLVDPFDTDALTRAMIELTTKPSMSRDLVARGMTRAAAFSWDSVARRTVEVYNHWDHRES
jgi:glycosyltransferase involved in cell wall biosynthesis